MANNIDFIKSLNIGQRLKINNEYNERTFKCEIIDKHLSGILVKEEQTGRQSYIEFQSEQYMKFDDEKAYFMIGQSISNEKAQERNLSNDYWLTLEVLD